jgi:hypothetical protein
LKPEDVEVIVFWTKDAKPILSKLNILDDKCYFYYFQYTLTNYSTKYCSNLPDFELLKEHFYELSAKIGNEKVIWRYDPIIICKEYSYERHLEIFSKMAKELNQITRKAVISFVDFYKKTVRNLKKNNFFENEFTLNPENDNEFEEFIKKLVEISRKNNIEIQSCSEQINLRQYGVKPGKCVDDALIKEVFNLDVLNKKDPGQRKECGCIKSIDIGVYNSCLHGCQFCYATRDYNLAKKNYMLHDSNSPSLMSSHGYF